MRSSTATTRYKLQFLGICVVVCCTVDSRRANFLPRRLASGDTFFLVHSESPNLMVVESIETKQGTSRLKADALHMRGTRHARLMVSISAVTAWRSAQFGAIPLLTVCICFSHAQ